MNWTDLLKQEMDFHYALTEKLLGLVDEDKMGWAPESGVKWMTQGQLIFHITESCGAAMRGFVTGDWKRQDAETYGSGALEDITTIAAARARLANDKQLGLEMLALAGEEGLENRPTPAPWDPSAWPLGRRLLQMVQHLNSHRHQLFYYLKLQGKPVDTGTLWMA